MIIASVGRGGVNRYNDTKAIQLLINDWRKAEVLPVILVDGIVGPQTTGAILEFQKQNSLPQDGRVDPNGPTLSRLDQICAGLYASEVHYHLSALMREFDKRYGGKRTILEPQVQMVRSLVSSFRPVRFTVSRIQPEPVLPTSVLGFAQAIPIILVFLLLIFLLLILTSNPVWQRSAKEFIKGLKERIQAMSEKVREAIDKASKAIEEALKNPECARAGMICSDKLIRFRQLVIDILEELNRATPNKFKLARLLEQFQDALTDLLNCLAENGCTVI
jgi:hypothetical protein